MSSVRAAVFHFLAAVGFGAVLVAAILPINFAAFAIWAYLVPIWVRSQADEGGRWAGAAELVIQLTAMSAIVLVAVSAPCKIVDRVKARHMSLPRQTMTIAELQEPESHELRRPTCYYSLGAPVGLTGRVVRFPSSDLTVGEFIAAIEAQTPLRHRFGHCGNGWTILWGGDCSFGLSFQVPPR